MLKKVALIGITAAAIVGTGGAALAATSTSSPAPSAAAGATTAPATKPATPGQPGAHTKPGHKLKAGAKAKRHGLDLSKLRDVDHASWVTGGAGHFVSHEASRGTVSAVSASSITVKSADASTATFTINPSTKVHTRANHKTAAIADVKVGDPVLVAGTGTGQPVAQQVLDTKK